MRVLLYQKSDILASLDARFEALHKEQKAAAVITRGVHGCY